MNRARQRVERCPQCDHRVFLDDLHCLNCGAELVYEPMVGGFALAVCPCLHRDERQCNWAAAADDAPAADTVTAPVGSTGPADDAPAAACRQPCAACRRITVSVQAAETPELVAAFCAAIRRTLRRLHDGFGIDERRIDPPLRFALERSVSDWAVTIGHTDGLITLDVAEADPLHRESQRTALGEPYRTPLGHVRHEVGHWVWAAAVAPCPGALDEFRSRFGDEQVDYQAALSEHYQQDDDGSWRQDWISRYAAAHPWEDFAESTAHVLHLDDVLHTAAVGRLAPAAEGSFTARYTAWTELVVELNEVTRAMGEDDLYPFAPPPAAVDKMHLAERLLRSIGSPVPGTA